MKGSDVRGGDLAGRTKSRRALLAAATVLGLVALIAGVHLQVGALDVAAPPQRTSASAAAQRLCEARGQGIECLRRQVAARREIVRYRFPTGSPEAELVTRCGRSYAGDVPPEDPLRVDWAAWAACVRAGVESIDAH